ncbi:hypothetical protein EDD86DRAFT_257035, partial [Gorgonomyces haynaldii]
MTKKLPSGVILSLKKKEEKELALFESLSLELRDQTYQCMVCFDRVLAKHPIWSCGTCYAVFHFKCVSEWASKSAGVGIQLNDMNMTTSFRCPGCQTPQDQLSDDSCFCRKVIRPSSNRHRPHSCGQTCAKQQKCPHKCTLVCHPGPCPPCQGKITHTKCFCRKETLHVPCSVYLEPDFVRSCAQPCNKVLDCGQHLCEQVCHEGDCLPCAQPQFNACFCGKKVSVDECGHYKEYSCAQVCGCAFPCELHKCDKVCHDGNHDICPLDPSLQSTCPCGKKTLESMNAVRSSCADPIPTCESTCQKKLLCGHKCQMKCHNGPCRSCPENSIVQCHCKKSTLTMPCKDRVSDGKLQTIECTRICNKKMSCKRHTCQNICCTLQGHECLNLCQKTLSCTKHKCMMQCGHPGKCHDCMEGVSFAERSCHCGATVQYPPIPCNAPPPVCDRSCTRPRPCGHPSYTRHQCHSDDTPCPPCMVFAIRECACGEKTFNNVPCSRAGKPSCGGPCKRSGEVCGHACGRFCHEGSCIDETHPCMRKCGQTRPLCGHVCQYPCHGTKECPQDQYCKEMLTVVCECGLKTKQRLCGVSAENPDLNLVLECDETCIKKKRQLQLAEAFGMDPNAPPAILNVQWPESLVRTAKNYKELVLQTEKKLKELIEMPSDSYFYFPRQKLSGANRIISEMATFYGFGAEILDERINKGTVSVWRSERRVPSLPPKLLSVVMENYDPLLPCVDPNILVDGQVDQEEVKTKILESIYEPNAVYVEGVPEETTTQEMITCLVSVLTSLNLVGRLHWLSNTSFYLTFERIEGWGGATKKQEDVFETLLLRLLDRLIGDMGWAQMVSHCQVISGYCHVKDRDDPLVSIKKRQVSPHRWSEFTSDGWQAPPELKNKGILLTYVNPSQMESM